MASQQATLGKRSNNCPSYPIQLHLSNNSSNLSRNLPVQFVTSSPNIGVPLRIPSSVVTDSTTTVLPLQLSGSNIIPLQLSSANAINVSMDPQKQIGNLSRAPQSLPLQLTSMRNASNPIIQLQMVGPPNMDKEEGLTDQEMLNQLGTRMIPVSSQPNISSVSGKVQDSLGYQLGGQRPLIPSSGNSVQISSSNSAVPLRTQARSILYFQKHGFKPVSNSETTVTAAPPLTSSIIVRKPPTSTGIQFLPTTLTKTSVAKSTPLTPKVPSNSLVIKKSKLPQNVVPVSIGAKNTLTIPYVSSIKKTSQENSLLAPSTSLAVPSSGNSKILLPYPKINSGKIILPVGMHNTMTTTVGSSSYNFQINNGQNDTPTNLSVVGTTAEVPPLHPFTKNVPTSVKGTSVSISKFPPDNTYQPSISGTRTEQIGDQEYSLSIPETNDSMNDDMYTVSISDDVENSPEKSFTIPIPEKAKSLICKTNITDVVLGQENDNINNASSVPAILRRSNAENNDKKIMRRRRSNSIKATPKLKDEKPSLAEQNRAISLLCTEEIDDVEARMHLDKTEGMVNIERIRNTINISKDRRKSRMSSDVATENNVERNTNIFKSDKSTVKQRKENLGLDNIMNDAPGLSWNNGIGELEGSELKFKMNEFGVIDLLEKVENGKYHKSNTVYGKRDKKSISPDEFYCCDGCGCHGMAAEFVTPNFCSKSCQINFEKKVKKEKVMQEIRKKKKPKKSIVQKKNQKEENDEPVNGIFDYSSDTNDNRLCIVEDYKIPEECTLSRKNNWYCSKSGFSWMKYLEFSKAIPIPENCFKDMSVFKNGFRKGMKLEAIDPVHPSIFAVVTISNIQGHRLCLHFDGYSEEFDFWVNIDSCNIFPAGWCEKNKKTLKTPIVYGQDFSWNIYLRQCKAIAAPKNLFQHLSDMHPCPNGFRVGMKLEAEDKKNSLTCVATVADVIYNRILIHFDSWDDIYDYWVDPTSPYIHPVGWCDSNGFSLTPPNSYKDPENFSWNHYLNSEKALQVPARAFKPRAPQKFKIGMKLEAVDKRVPFLIRVATISDLRCHQIRISFDGWPDELSYWVDDDCPDIHPINWCLRTGHSLEPPLTFEESQTVGDCGTNGCRGFGNLCCPRRNMHYTAEECPYRLPASSPPFRDRLDENRPPPELSEPRPREPRKSIQVVIPDVIEIKHERVAQDFSIRFNEVSENNMKRKIKEDKRIELMMSDEEATDHSKRKRRSSPVTQVKIENSVYEPGYIPNPSRITPPFWGMNSLSLKEIMEKESFRVDPRNWNQTEVLRFIELVTKCQDFAFAFSKHCIDGESFLMLSQEDLVNILEMKLGPAIKIYNSILQLRQKVLS